MNINETKIINILEYLKGTNKVVSLKAEFEDEGSSLEDIFRLKELSHRMGLGLTVKISGCGALNDLIQLNNIGVSTIVAPMVETPYALKKFVQITKETGLNSNLFINIETITGYENFNEISAMSEFKELTGIVVGRFDLAKSIGLGCKDIHSEIIFNIVKDLSTKTSETGKIFAVGGGVKSESLEFFKKLPYINLFETRKVVFDADYAIKNNDTSAILKAIEFEMLWLENKSYRNKLKPHEVKRLNILKSRLGIPAEKHEKNLVY